MRDPDGFEGYGTILELLEKDRFLVEMPNRHRVYGVIQKKTKIGTFLNGKAKKQRRKERKSKVKQNKEK